jgi:hypothetical protein
MTMKINLFNSLIILSIISNQVWAEDELANVPNPPEWTLSTLPQFTYASYNGSENRDFVVSYGADLSAQYLERGGFQVGVSRAVLTLKSVDGAAPTFVTQNNLFLSGHRQFTPDGWAGEFTVQADLLRAYNDDSTNQTNGVAVIAPKISFLNFEKTYYLDLGLASSSYGVSKTDNSTLSVLQTSPTLGFAFNQGSDWLQLRVYDIRFSTDSVSSPTANNRAQNLTQTDALNIKWIHFLTAQNGMPNKIQLGGLVGKRLYAVDGGSLYNFSDIQQGGVSLSLQWSLDKASQFNLQSGIDQYNAGKSSTDPNKDVLYTGAYLYLGLLNQW